MAIDVTSVTVTVAIATVTIFAGTALHHLTHMLLEQTQTFDLTLNVVVLVRSNPYLIVVGLG